ncbi:RNA polymerase sigma factor [Streptomyces sp. DT2A-34]|uniref:RNA polymerase sigma factor n=1 Tax=Streptomyces sp. DT2A-34 TaxID=3051182 RepID=UPI00265B9761|nr:RNA polymerase sigma factor [Streptomyces sp. DT2A-34]MDO0912639.1 RNA polymerase sigma factor [Streptomyces sp. DT2A-34]
MTLAPSSGAAFAAATAANGGSDGSVIERSWETPDTFAVIFDRYADDIHRYIARRLGSDTADDLMAETFVIAFQRRRRYDLSHAHARPWLYGIATNLIGRHRRDEARRLRALSRMAALPPGQQDSGPEHAVTEKLGAGGTHGALAGALAELPARYRDVLFVIAWGDLDYEEAAQALDVPVGTVRSRLHRARTRLRRALGGPDRTPSTAPQKETDHG